MPLSTRFREMRSRLSQLRLHMLPQNFSPTGDYSDRQLDRARGYRLLVHAEIESFLEDVSRETTTNAIRQWKRDGKPSSVIVAFLASYHSGWSVGDSLSQEEIVQLAKSRVKLKDRIDEVIDVAQKQFIQRVKDNHGIKDKNFKALILPVGIDTEDLDATWLTNMDNFGSLRGEVAHKTMRATGVISPQDEYNAVKRLLTGLEDLDRKICSISL
jgi:hypothetical protein